MLTKKKLLAFLNWLWFPEQGNPRLLLPEFWQPRKSRRLRRSRSTRGLMTKSPSTVWKAVNLINGIVISFEISQSLITNHRRTKRAKACKDERQSGFQMTVEKSITKSLLWPITTAANSAMNQSEWPAITCNLLKAREKVKRTRCDWFWFRF